MQVSREDLNPCTVKLTVVCTADQVKAAYDKAYKQAAKRVRIPGFRPGHAPKHLVQQSVAPEAITEMAQENLLEGTFNGALKQEGIEPGGQSSVESMKIDEAAGTGEYAAKVPLPPKVELGEYKGIEVTKPNDEVTDAEVEARLDEMRKTKGMREAVEDRGAQDGDAAVVNIRVDGGEAEGRNFMIVVGQSFKALDAALHNMNVEEMKSLDLKFPKDFQDAEWAGKSHHCTVTLRSLNTMALPELDDEFAKSMKAENLDELKQRLKDIMMRRKTAAVSDFVTEKILDGVLTKSTIHIPDSMWESVAQRKLQDTAMEQQRAGVKFEDYVAAQGMTVEQYVQAQKDEAKLFVQRAVMVREIFAAEKMELVNAEINVELFDMAREYQVSPQDLLTVLRKNKAVDDLYFRAIYRKVTKFLTENAKLTTA